LDYADSNALTNVACSVCSIAGFDDSLVENSITYQEFYDYLQKTPKEKNGAETYLNYLYSTSGLANFENSFFISNYLDESIDPGKSYFIVTGMSKSSVWGLFGSNHLPVVIMEKTSANYDKIGCSEFLTKS
ncbi:MAG: hypothetical protein KJ905_01650, partial [Nanoarchaeota archaeon]|nr:hypothetical protein [Nanoarchaeota archaeon]